MRQAMGRMEMTRQLNANRALSATMSFLALAGWEAAVEDLAQLQAQIASARAELQALTQQRGHAKAQAGAGQQDRTGLTKVLEGRPKGSNKVRVAKPASKPAKIAAQT